MDGILATTTTSKPLIQSNQSGSFQTGDSAVTSDFDTYLQLLTAQLKYQDPLKPTPADEFAVQLATFSSVEQQVLTNELLVSLGAQFEQMGAGQYQDWIGMEARATTPVEFSGAAITLSPSPATGADRTELVVRSGSGQEVDRFDIPVSNANIEWNGMRSDGIPHPYGTYTFELVSFANGSPLASSTVESYGRIVEVRGEESGLVFALDTGAMVPIDEITGLRENPG